MQDPKKSPKTTIWHHPTTLSGYIFATKACIDNRKKRVKQQCLLYMSTQYMVNFGPLAAEIVSLVWGTPGNFNGLLHGSLVSSGRQPNCGIEQRTPAIFGRAAITLGIRPHF